MALLYNAMTDFVILKQTETEDELGGSNVEYIEGDVIKCAIAQEQSSEIVVADKACTKDTFTIITSKDIVLQYNDILKRVSDGKTFRVTSDGTERQTPFTARLDMRAVSGERWEIDA